MYSLSNTVIYDKSILEGRCLCLTLFGIVKLFTLTVALGTTGREIEIEIETIVNGNG